MCECMNVFMCLSNIITLETNRYVDLLVDFSSHVAHYMDKELYGIEKRYYEISCRRSWVSACMKNLGRQ